MQKKLIALSLGLAFTGLSYGATFDIGALVSGQVTQVLVTPGKEVKEGELMVVIDDRQAKAEVVLAQAEVDLAKIKLVEVETNFDEDQTLYDGGSLSKKIYDNSKRQVDIAKIQLTKAQAKLNIAKAKLSYHQIHAPKKAKVVSIKVVNGQTLYNENQPIISLSY